MDGRSALRKDLSALRFSTLTILAPDGRVLEANVLDANGLGLSILVDDDPEPLAVGTRVELALRLEGSLLRMPAIVRNHVGRDGADRYGLEFVSPVQVDEQIRSSAVRALLERRSSPRVRLGPGGAGAAVLCDERWGGRVEGTIEDLSVEGVCIEVTNRDAELLAHSERVFLELRLPGEERWLGLAACLRQRFQRARRTLLALELAPETAREAPFTLDVLRGFVERRLAPGRRAG